MMRHDQLLTKSLSDNQGMTSPTSPEDPFAGLAVDEPVSIVDRVADELRRAMFDGDLTPGTPLREVALAASLGVSRATVREALGFLVAEGLADRVTHRGTAVRTLAPADVTDVCRARLALELAGVDRWADASEAARQAVRDALASYTHLAGRKRPRPSATEVTAAHLAIHRTLVALIGSERLLSMADVLYAEIRLALASVDRARGNLAEQVHHHTDLVDLLEAGDLAGARADLVAHLEGAEASLLASLGLDEPTTTVAP